MFFFFAWTSRGFKISRHTCAQVARGLKTLGSILKLIFPALRTPFSFQPLARSPRSQGSRVLDLKLPIRALEPALSTAGQQLGKCSGRISRRRFLYRDLISQRNCHAIPQQWFERPKTSKSTSFA